MHVVLFGDFKQLPPATSKAPFIVDPSVTSNFTFRVLRENRRVCRDATRAEELEGFHQVLTDISWGKSTAPVRDFIVQAYVRGAEVGCAESRLRREHVRVHEKTLQGQVEPHRGAPSRKGP